MSKIYAPFTPEQVQILNEVQASTCGDMPKFHPFTCPSRGEADHAPANAGTDLLIATENGWVCPFCAHQQDWAYAVMASPSAGECHPFLERLGVKRGDSGQRSLLDRLIAAYMVLRQTQKLSINQDEATNDAAQHVWATTSIMIQSLYRKRMALMGVRRIGDRLDIAPSWTPRAQAMPDVGQRVEVLLQDAQVGNDVHPGFAIKAWVSTAMICPEFLPDIFDIEMSQGGRVTHWRDPAGAEVAVPQKLSA